MLNIHFYIIGEFFNSPFIKPHIFQYWHVDCIICISFESLVCEAALFDKIDNYDIIIVSSKSIMHVSANALKNKRLVTVLQFSTLRGAFLLN